MVYDHGIPNFAKVDVGIYRSGQITSMEGWQYLKQATGGKRIHVIKLNYNNEGSDGLAIGLGYDVHVLSIQPQGDKDVFNDLIGAFIRPDNDVVLEAVALLMGADADDVWLVHCTHGQDRTGYVIGKFRVLAQDWSKARAYKEMLKYHFHPELLGLQSAWESLRGN